VTSHDHEDSLVIGERDVELNERLSSELDVFNFAATGVSDQGTLSVKAVDSSGDLIGGVAGWTWGGLCGLEMMWVREDCRRRGWGSRILRAAEAEAQRRGCDRVGVSSFTFQAPGFYQRHGYRETGRTLGIPGGHEDVHMFKSLASAQGQPEDGAARTAVARHVAAFNRHDTQGLLQTLAADAVWNTGQDTIRGHQALAELFDDGLWALKPSLAVRTLLAEEDRVAAQFDEELTIQGQVRRFVIAGFFHVRAGRVQSAKIFREGSADIQ
jgi:ribosomal protein S18 acetylase RimI-like enzyme